MGSFASNQQEDGDGQGYLDVADRYSDPDYHSAADLLALSGGV
jgi:hypothetical protein